MGVVAISAAVAVMGGMAVGIEVAGMGAAGTEAIRIGMVVLPIGGGIIHTLTGLTVGKSWFENRNEPQMDASAVGFGFHFAN